MKQMLIALAAPVLVLAPLPVAAQDAPGTSPAPANAAPVDPARLATARITVDHIFPLGTYARLMGASMNGMLDKMADSTTQIPLRELAGMGGLAPAQMAKLGKGTLAEIMVILDPAYRQRMNVIMHATLAGMTRIMTQLEPSIREGLVQAYASRFTLAQLSDMNRFFDTPSGQAYAANAMTIRTYPEVMARMQAIVPQLMAQLPAIMSQATAAAADLPKQRKISDLSPAEQAKLASLLGVPASDLGHDKPAN